MKDLSNDELRLLSYILLRATGIDNVFNLHNEAVEAAKELMVKINKES